MIKLTFPDGSIKEYKKGIKVVDQVEPYAEPIKPLNAERFNSSKALYKTNGVNERAAPVSPASKMLPETIIANDAIA